MWRRLSDSKKKKTQSYWRIIIRRMRFKISPIFFGSLYLAQAAAEVDADLIVLAGVHFMAETAKIINPTKKVLLPDLKAGCSLADSCPPLDFTAFKAQNPDVVVVTYINC